MEAIRKQATKLREQVAKQQQSILKQFGGRFGHESFLVDEVEMQCYQKLQMLYASTKAAKRLQRDVVHGVEAFIAISSRQMEIMKKMAENCCKYGNEHQHSAFPLAKASISFGDSHKLMEKERDNLLGSFGDQVYEPLQTMLTSAPLEDARLLTYRYRRIRQDMEAQTEEVVRRQLRSKESGPATEVAAKLQNAESRLSELRTTLLALGREATAAMMAVEAKQQQTTFQCLLAMVDAERAYHQNVTSILDKLHDEMVQIKEHHEHVAQPGKTETQQSPPENKIANGSQSEDAVTNGQDKFYFVGEVIHPFDAQADGELSLSVGDYVVIRQVAPNGWSEGECKGKAGWFPSAYVEQRDKAPASKVIEPQLLT